MNKKYLPIVSQRYPYSIQNCLNDFKKSWEDLDKLNNLNANWEKLVGLELSRACKPLKIQQTQIKRNYKQIWNKFK